MKLAEMEFTREFRGTACVFPWEYEGWSVCSDLIECIGDYFELPRDITLLAFSLHDRPALNRVRCEVAWYIALTIPELIMGRGEFENTLVVCDTILDDILSPLAGRVVYLQAEYE